MTESAEPPWDTYAPGVPWDCLDYDPDEGADDETEYEVPTFPWKPAPSFDASRLATGEHPF
jgi:hypothetical protein